MLPAGNLLEHQQANLVAAIEEVARLRIVRGADNIAVEILAKDFGILPLYARRHGLAGKRKCLVTIQSAQLHDFAVE